MKVLLTRVTEYELILDDDGFSQTYGWLQDIPDVLEDDTADDEEKLKTIVYCFQGDFGVPSHQQFSVLITSDNNDTIFTGILSD